MNMKDAFKILSIFGNVTSADVKAAYRKACSLYHPDRNPAGHEMMQLVNAAYEVLKDFEGNADINNDFLQYGEELNTALNIVISLGLEIEICGAWIWLTGNTKPHREKLKEAGFKWAPKKARWYFRPEDYKCRRHLSWSMEKIREKYNSVKVESEQRKIAH